MQARRPRNAAPLVLQLARLASDADGHELKCQSASGVEQRLPRLVNHCFSTGGKADDCSH